MIAAEWRCWRCGHRAELNLQHTTYPAPKCPACVRTIAPSGERYLLDSLVHADDVKYRGPVDEATMLPLLRTVCAGCDAVYGEGKNKPIWGYCSKCWGAYLETMAENRRKMGFA